MEAVKLGTRREGSMLGVVYAQGLHLVECVHSVIIQHDAYIVP